MAKYVVEGASLIAIAASIREKTGKTASLTLAQMPTEIGSIESGGEEQIADLTAENTELKAQNDELQTQVWDLTEEKEHLSDEIENLNYNIENLTAENAELTERIEELESGSGGSSGTGISKLALLASGQPFALTAEDLEGAEIIVEEAFYAAYITEITIPSNVKEIVNYAFGYKNTLKKVTIHEGLITLGSGAFSYCEQLEEVNLPASLTEGYSAFQGCTSLSKVTLNEGISVIDQYMFYGCTALTEIYFPKSITRIKTNAFACCDSMQVYDFSQHDSIPTLDLYLKIPDGCEIRVPASLYSRWKAATNWSTYAANIVSV